MRLKEERCIVKCMLLNVNGSVSNFSRWGADKVGHWMKMHTKALLFQAILLDVARLRE